MTKEKAEILVEALSKLGLKPILTTASSDYGVYDYSVTIERGLNYLISFDTNGVMLMKWDAATEQFLPYKEIEWDFPPEN